MLRRRSRGDTLVEVIVAFTVFTVVAVGTTSLMNRGISLAEQSLEITLVREQIDAQGAMIRYARSLNTGVWQSIRAKAQTVSSVPNTNMTSCPAAAPANSFMLSVDTSGPANQVKYYDLTAAPSPYTPASVHSRFDASSSAPKFEGMWVVPIKATDTGGTSGVNAAYDMHIGTCWYVPGSNRPFTLATIVRIYDKP
ncbi:MAG TPA: prepilin-type N-terminal cleavage/methylation domain-containing protein [Patescibacteria group bacterium]|nr:prepilin-type N-terminal cleavage/methylation domain-containing protein [Patescibacteria group bacterium]